MKTATEKPTRYTVHSGGSGITFGMSRSPSATFEKDAAATLALIRPAVKVEPKLAKADFRRVVPAALPLARNMSSAGARRIAADSIGDALDVTRKQGEDDLQFLARLRRMVVGDDISKVSSSLLETWLRDRDELTVDDLLEERRRTWGVVKKWRSDYEACQRELDEARRKQWERTGEPQSDAIDWRQPPFSDLAKRWHRASVREFGCFADASGLYPSASQEAKARLPILENELRRRYERGERPKDLDGLKAELVARRAEAEDAADRLAVARRAARIDPAKAAALDETRREYDEARRNVDKARDAIRSGLCWKGAA